MQLLLPLCCYCCFASMSQGGRAFGTSACATIPQHRVPAAAFWQLCGKRFGFAWASGLGGRLARGPWGSSGRPSDGRPLGPAPGRLLRSRPAALLQGAPVCDWLPFWGTAGSQAVAGHDIGLAAYGPKGRCHVSCIIAGGQEGPQRRGGGGHPGAGWAAMMQHCCDAVQQPGALI